MSGLNEAELAKSDRFSRRAEGVDECVLRDHDRQLRKLKHAQQYQFALLEVDRQRFLQRRCTSARRTVRSFLTPTQISSFDRQAQRGKLDCSYTPVTPNFAARIQSRGTQISRELACARPACRTPDGFWSRYLPFQVTTRSPSPTRSSNTTARFSRPQSTVWFARESLRSAKSTDSTAWKNDETALSRPSTAGLAERERQKMQTILKQISEFNNLLAPPKDDSESEYEDEYDDAIIF